jgi:hypothetical protein
MIRMLVLGYVFAIRSERALCRDVQVNFAYAAQAPVPRPDITRFRVRRLAHVLGRLFQPAKRNKQNVLADGIDDGSVTMRWLPQ